jgi:hypothetical protein
MLRLFLGISRFFGARRRFIRRIAALALIIIGVHRAADILDDAVFAVIDVLDLWVDQSAWAVLEWLSSLGAFDGNEAVDKAQRFAEWFDLAEKDLAAKWIALFLELLIDVLLLEFAWGTRPDMSHHGLIEEFRESGRQLLAALWPLDLERLAVPVVLFCFAVKGSLFAGIAAEALLAGAITENIPLWRPGPNIAAFVGLCVAGLLLWRFLPDLLHGGILRVGERAKAFGEKQAEKAAAADTRLKRLRLRWRAVRRGAFLALVVMPMAVMGVVTQSAFVQLVARVGGVPS